MDSASRPQDADYLAFQQRYLTTFLCALKKIHIADRISGQCGGTDHHERSERAAMRALPLPLLCSSSSNNGDAVKYAANLSLALSVQGNPLWSRVLLTQLKLPWHHRARSIHTPLSKMKKAVASKRHPAYLKVARRRRARTYQGAVAKRVLSRVPSSFKRSARYRQHLVCSKYAKVLRSLSRSRQASIDVNTSSSTAMKRHVSELGELVPGGYLMDTPLLLQQTAHYIHSLHSQIQALQSLLKSSSST